MVKPVIFAVDDEPEVLNAVERDLRHHFAANYRVMKAQSGTQALEATRHLKDRGTPVALFLVDQKMPGMSGTEFLVEAMKVYPDARRVLLTAYADTQVAIAGINTVGLDYYLLKPWEPPEQRLFPALDDLLLDWIAKFRPPYDGLRVAGTALSASSYTVKDFLSRNQIPYQWVDLDTDAPTRERILSMPEGMKRLPVLFFDDGTSMVQPTTREIADRLGMQTHPKEVSFYQFVVVGGGPAGLAAAVYGASEGLRTLLIERDAPGGQAGTSSRIENYLGFPSGISGADLARRATDQARRFGAEIVSAQDVVEVKRRDPYRIAVLSDGSEVSAYAILIAPGMQVRQLDAPGVSELAGAGVYYGAAPSEAAMYRGKHVFVVGGANSAGQGAIFFSRQAKQVTMLVRGTNLESSMSRYLIDRIKETTNIEVLFNTAVAAAHGNGKLEGVTLATGEEKKDVEADAMFIFIGSSPRTEAVANLVERDPGGFILTGRDLLKDGKWPQSWTANRDPFLLETSVPGVFAAGDARHGSGKRVAAAVGEGSATVSMVHQYLETV
jgi:thioredoxin reductase (NADPH)